MKFNYQRVEIKFLSYAIFLLAMFFGISPASKLKANSTKEEFCRKIDNKVECLDIINNIPPLNKLPRIHSSLPIKIKVIPYKKRYTSFREKQSNSTNNYSIGGDNYLYELR